MLLSPSVRRATIALLCSLSLSFACANDLSIAPVNTLDVTLDPFVPDTDRGSSMNDSVANEDIEITQFDLWDRIRKGFAIPDLNNPLVQNHSTWYSSRPEYIQRTTVRASRYLFHVVQELEKRQMPMELALLPFIESAFNPQAYSSAKAAGMWQFIPSTGRDYHLQQNVFRDERRDVLASTSAALNYLEKLYRMFGDWQLALAAYNWGEGSVSRAIAKAEAQGRPIDFNSLSAFMPNETRNYYPKLQAVKNIIANPARYDITLPVVENQPYFVSVKKTRDIDIKLAAQLAELPMDEFKALNPQFNRPVITGSANTQILLPQPNAEKFKDNLSKWTRTLSSWTAHKVTAARERIETIAAKFKTTPEVIREANAIPPNMHPKAGSTVLVPKLATTADKDIGQDIADKATLAVESDAPPRRKITVKVGKRDTLMSLSKKYNVTMAEVREWNQLKTDKLTPGQSLKLEVKASKRLPSKSSNRVERPARAERLSISNRAPRAKSNSAKSQQTTTKVAPAHRRQRAD